MQIIQLRHTDEYVFQILWLFSIISLEHFLNESTHETYKSDKMLLGMNWYHILKLIMLAPSYLILNGLNVFAVKWYSTYRHRVRIINLLLLCCTPMVYLIVFFLYHVNTCYSCYLLPFIILPRLCIASHTHDLMKMTSFTFNRHKVSQSILTLNTWFYFYSVMTSDKGHCYSQLEFQYILIIFRAGL